MSRSSPLTALCLSLALAIAACDDDGAPPRDTPSTTLPAATTAPSPEPSADLTTSTSAAEARPSFAEVAGNWEAAYEAKKGFITMPSGIDDPNRKADDGKAASGPGSVKITIKPDGDVSGKSQGALGNATIRGKIDGKMLRTSFVPDDMTAPQAMTGVLVGIIKGDKIQCELRVAGPDALIVRRADFDLVKKP